MMRSITAICLLGSVQQSIGNGALSNPRFMQSSMDKSADDLVNRDARGKFVDMLINKLLDQMLVVRYPYGLGSDATALDKYGNVPPTSQATDLKLLRPSDATSFQPLGLRPSHSEELLESASTSMQRPRLPLSARVPSTLRNHATRITPLTLANKNTSNVMASLFGVGAPEAVVIGVVALTVFGPKGLADVVKQASSTLKQFQPTIREIQDVSQGFQQTLKDEILTDEIQDGVRDLQSTLRGDFLTQDLSLRDKERKNLENIATPDLPSEPAVPANAQVPTPAFQPSEIKPSQERPAGQQKPRLADMSVDMLREELKKKKER